MENVLQSAKKLNYSLPQEAPLKRSMSTNPTMTAATVAQPSGDT